MAVKRRPRARERERREQELRELQEKEARRVKEEAARVLGEFIIEADEQRLELIERYGVTALVWQHSENLEAYRRETKRWQLAHARATMADALHLAKRHPPRSGRVVLYSQERTTWTRGAKSVLGDPCMEAEAGRPAAARRKEALSALAKLAIGVEHVDPNS